MAQIPCAYSAPIQIQIPILTYFKKVGPARCDDAKIGCVVHNRTCQEALICIHNVMYMVTGGSISWHSISELLFCQGVNEHGLDVLDTVLEVLLWRLCELHAFVCFQELLYSTKIQSAPDSQLSGCTVPLFDHRMCPEQSQLSCCQLQRHPQSGQFHKDRPYP